MTLRSPATSNLSPDPERPPNMQQLPPRVRHINPEAVRSFLVRIIAAHSSINKFLVFAIVVMLLSTVFPFVHPARPYNLVPSEAKGVL